LHFAVRSPIGGAEEQEYSSILSGNRLVCLFVAKLVKSFERRGGITFRWPGIVLWNGLGRISFPG
jgi:hypothetical protein